MFEIKEFLNRHYEISRAIDAKLEQIEELKSLAQKITVGPFRESHGEGGYTDRVGRTTARIVDLEEEINREIDRLVDIKTEIWELIYTLPDTTERTVLERHYLLHEGWERIADKLGYSARHITRLHNRALSRLEEAFHARGLSKAS
ncbi:MAG: DUF1492 domain-containing protein [Bacteroides sp.]|nr:DUF1492 domain-containing protein [Eubacterium sp.]MCM1419364.1 DUF1492 domain-containing protein [Roseburia sp.]MCM1463014.1 DUF1492 domain-containing protein [Bacteroides sp.]